MTAEEPAVPAPDTHQADATILVVDDDPSVRAAIARLVQTAGWKVQEFPSAATSSSTHLPSLERVLASPGRKYMPGIEPGF